MTQTPEERLEEFKLQFSDGTHLSIHRTVYVADMAQAQREKIESAFGRLSKGLPTGEVSHIRDLLHGIFEASQLQAPQPQPVIRDSFEVEISVPEELVITKKPQSFRLTGEQMSELIEAVQAMRQRGEPNVRALGGAVGPW